MINCATGACKSFIAPLISQHFKFIPCKIARLFFVIYWDVNVFRGTTILSVRRGDKVVIGGDGQVIVGTGTDASPTGATLCGATGYVQGIASTTATNGTYGFWTFQYAAATGVIGGIFCTEGVAPGSTADTDGDPSWRLRATDSNFWNSNGAAISWWNKYNLAGESYITGGQFATFTLSNASFSPQFYYISGPAPVGQDPYGGKTGFYPLMVGKNGVYPKGYTSGISQGTTLQNLIDVFNISSAEPRITVNIGTVSALALFVIPWVPNIIPSV